MWNADTEDMNFLQIFFYILGGAQAGSLRLRIFGISPSLLDIYHGMATWRYVRYLIA